MNLNDILNQVLGAGQKMAQNSSNPQNDTLLKVGGGMAAGTLLSMLLGRKGTGQIAKAGSLAAVGALAYRAYQNWQQSQNQGQAASALQGQFEAPHDRGGQAGEDASRIILRTMIAAAAAGSPAAKWLGLAAVVLASVNIFGGFAVTERMLAMYKKKEKKGGGR